MTMEYAFEQPNGHWQHRATLDFRNEAHAMERATRAGLVYRGTFRAPDQTNAPGSAVWCETCGDNR